MRPNTTILIFLIFTMFSWGSFAKEKKSLDRKIASISDGVWGCASLRAKRSEPSVYSLYLSQGDKQWVLFDDFKIFKPLTESKSDNLFSVFLNDYCTGQVVVPRSGVLCCKINKPD